MFNYLCYDDDDDDNNIGNFEDDNDIVINE